MPIPRELSAAASPESADPFVSAQIYKTSILTDIILTKISSWAVPVHNTMATTNMAMVSLFGDENGIQVRECHAKLGVVQP